MFYALTNFQFNFAQLCLSPVYTVLYSVHCTMYMFSYQHVLVVHIMRRSKHTSSKFISIFIIQILHNITTLPV
jgi:hypothetical protein